MWGSLMFDFGIAHLMLLGPPDRGVYLVEVAVAAPSSWRKAK